MAELTHFSPDGSSRMVDVGEKPMTLRMARAEGEVVMKPETLQLLLHRKAGKGDVLEVARLAGIMAAKQTATLIPLCHQVPLDRVSIEFRFPSESCVTVESFVSCTARTGVEMEALTAVSVVCLTIYDMCKAVDRGMQIERIRLIEKSGGRSGHFVRDVAAT
jgi:cyclic pyranopterin phosphate synthase